MFTVRVGSDERTITREELEQYADLVGLGRVAEHRYCWRFVLDLLICDEFMGVDPSMVVREIEALEKGKTGTGTKPAAEFERDPLRGLWHKHFFSTHFVVENIRIELGKGKLKRVIKDTLEPQASRTITREMITGLARKVTVEPFEKREEAGKLTGEWIVFAKCEGKNYYLCIATHRTGDQAIYDRIKDACTQQFPFLVAQLHPRCKCSRRTGRIVMLNQLAFANSLAILTGGLYVLFGLLALVSPRAFQLLFNAQFFGADVAALLPKVTPSAVSLVTFVIVVSMSWVVGYVWAWLYNRIAKTS